MMLITLLLFGQVQDTALATRVDSIIHEHMTERHIPGASVALVRDGKILLQRSYGNASIELGSAVTDSSVFLLASITKSFTAAGIMMLVREGKVDLEAPIGRYLDSIPEGWQSVLVRQVLTHTAGLADRFEFAPGGRMYMEYTTRQMYDAARATRTVAPPGERFQYSDQGYFLLGMIIERVSGKSYRDFLRERIFAPSGMRSATTLNQYELIPNRAFNYQLIRGNPAPARRLYQFGLVSHFGIMASAGDLARFAIALEGGALLASDRETLWTPATLSNGRTAGMATAAYGFGWFLEPFNGHRVVFHGGSTGTSLMLLPDDKVAVVVLTNLEQISGSDPDGIARELAGLLVPEITWEGIHPGPDPDTTFTAFLQEELGRYADGTPDSARYTPEFWQRIRGTLPAQRSSFQQFGPLHTLQFLFQDRLGSNRLGTWRAEFANIVLYVKAVRNEEGKMTWLSAQP